MIPVILTTLLSQGMNLVANAALSKGKEWVKEKTGVDLEKASLSSDELLKLKQFEMDHEEELLKLRQNDDKLSAELEIAYLKDVQSARDMQVTALNQEDEFSKRFIYYFSLIWSLSAITYIGAITFLTVPEDNVRFADTILGMLMGTLIAQIMNFFYGSSRSSQTKDDMIRSVVERKTQ